MEETLHGDFGNLPLRAWHIVVVDEALKSIDRLCHGVDFGSDIEIVAQHGLYAVYRIKGHSTWAGNFMPWRYAETQYGILKFDDLDLGGEGNVSFWRIKESKRTPGHGWHKCLAELTAEAERRNGEDLLDKLLNAGRTPQYAWCGTCGRMLSVEDALSAQPGEFCSIGNCPIRGVVEEYQKGELE